MSFIEIHVAQRKMTLIARPHHKFANENLIYHGYLGCSPVYPALAISLRTLSLFQQARCVCPRFGIQVQCKILCHLHNVSRMFTVYSLLTSK